MTSIIVLARGRMEHRVPHPTVLADTNAHPLGWTVRDLEPTYKKKKIINIKPNSHHLQKSELFSRAELTIYVTKALRPFGIHFLRKRRSTGHEGKED